MSADHLIARIAVINLIHEARGLDTFEITLSKFEKHNDQESITVLKRNFCEEIHHVAVGIKWFKYLCEREDLDPTTTFRGLAQKYFHGKLKGPFNVEARLQAGMPPEWYLDL